MLRVVAQACPCMVLREPCRNDNQNHWIAAQNHAAMTALLIELVDEMVAEGYIDVE